MRRRSLRAAAALVLVVQSLLLLVCQPADAQSAHGDHDHSHMLHEPQGDADAPIVSADHSSHSSHAGMSHGSMSMPMYFVPRATGPLLFSWADVTTTGAYLAFGLTLALACGLREVLSVWRMQVETANSQMAQLHSTALPSPDSAGRLETQRFAGSGVFSAPVLSSLLYGLNMALAYCIMLVVMSYDVTYFAIIILSSCASHYYFHHHRPTAASRTTSSGRAQMGRMRGDDEIEADLQGRFSRDSSVSPLHASSASQGWAKSPNPAKTSAATLLAVTKDCCES